jgi:hypothetical protein
VLLLVQLRVQQNDQRAIHGSERQLDARDRPFPREVTRR